MKYSQRIESLTVWLGRLKEMYNGDREHKNHNVGGYHVENRVL